MTRTALLAQVSYFAALDETELRNLAESCRLHTFARGEVLFNEGDDAANLYVLQSGQVKVVLIDAAGEETILHVAGAGESLGELSLVDGEPRSATAVALTPVEALALHREEFLALLERRRAVERAVMKRLAQLVRAADGHRHDASSLPSPERLAKKLLELAERHGEQLPQGVRISAALTQQDLARLVGMTRVSVHRYLNRLEEEGVLTADREGITIHQPEVLRRRTTRCT